MSAGFRTRMHGWFSALALALVPLERRAEWAREWQAELWYLKHDNLGHEDGRRLAGQGHLWEAMSLAWGMVADATWIRVDAWREALRGSAAACLMVLAGCCLICAGVERVLAGSWWMFGRVLAVHFVGCFAFVAVPGIFAAVATYPVRPLRCEGEPGRWFLVRLSARARWNLFLSAKVVLTLMLGFLASVVLTYPVRAEIGETFPKLVIFVELLTTMVVVSTGLRWALLNQEKRCQHCLRMMSEPTRVGPPSRNFLDWNGTALECSHGHGRLHVSEMQGSWCWYDRWVELDLKLESGWRLFGA